MVDAVSLGEEELLGLLHCQVSLLLKDKKTVLKGEVVNVDVETGMIFLACDAEKGSTVVMLHAILRLDVDARAAPSGPAVGTSTEDERVVGVEGVDSSRRKARVLELMRDRLVPHQALPDGNIIVLGILTLRAPYTSLDCVCSNEIVLSKVKVMLEDPKLELESVA